MNNKVVDLTEIRSDIVLVTMHDRESKNTYTPKFVADLRDAFEEISMNPQYKVAILTGYDNYFCSGGTKEALLDIQENKATFLSKDGDKNIYSLPLDCEIPVISAMQGHAIGGGFSLGLFADFVIMAKESIYTASFMKYGFTPGFGATCIFREKLGLSLAEELLITANTYHGGELQKKGIPFDVYPRKEVLNQAIELAKVIAEKPRLSLITLKSHLVSDIRKKLPQIIQEEVKMHEITFHQEEVRDNILNLY